MGSQSVRGWSRYEEMGRGGGGGGGGGGEVFTFPSQLPPLDFTSFVNSSVITNDQFDWHVPFPYDIPMQECGFDAISLTEMVVQDPLHSSLDIVPPQQNHLQGDLMYGYGSGMGNVWSEMNSGFENKQNQGLLLGDYYYVDNHGGDQKGSIVMSDDNEEQKRVSRIRHKEEKGGNCSKMLTRETISQYFYMPITQAAKDLNVGLTLLKKRCRELGIRRWPHRKLMSLQTLIKNVQELGKEGGEESEEKLKAAIEVLEQEKKLMEDKPDMQLEDKTKRLRQACFKANYKKRKIMSGTAMIDYQSPSSGGSNVSAASNAITEFGANKDVPGLDDDEEDIMSSLLSDCFSSTNKSLF